MNTLHSLYHIITIHPLNGAAVLQACNISHTAVNELLATTKRNHPDCIVLVESAALWQSAGAAVKYHSRAVAAYKQNPVIRTVQLISSRILAVMDALKFYGFNFAHIAGIK